MCKSDELSCVIDFSESAESARKERRSKEDKYKQKLLKLLEDSEKLDKRIAKNTETLIKRMRSEILAKTAEAQSASSSGSEPKWGHYWYDKLRSAYNQVISEIGDQFHVDLSKYLIQAAENGAKITSQGFKISSPSLQLIDNGIDPEQLKIASSFSADLITGLKSHQFKEINKQIALSASMREGASDLINRLAAPLDKGPWKSIMHRQKLIGVTESARVQELGRQLRFKQLQRGNPTVQLLQQYLCEHHGKYPCNQCFGYDGNVYDVEGNLVIRAKGKTLGLMPTLPIHPGCFTGDTLVKIHGILEKVYRRRYSGPMVRVEFMRTDGRLDFFSATPNHPILSSTGWVGAGELIEGDYLIDDSFTNNLIGSNLDIDNPYTEIEKIFESAQSYGLTKNVSGNSGDFHGDGQQGDVDIVFPNSQLSNGLKSGFLYSSKNLMLVLFDNQQIFLSSFSCLMIGFLGSCSPCHSFSLFFSGAFVSDLLGFAHSSNRSSSFYKDSSDSSSAYIKSFGDLKFGDSTSIHADDLFGELLSSNSFVPYSRVTGISFFDFDGHVYNLQTSVGFYSASGIPSKNCFCSYVPYVTGFSPEPDQEPDDPIHLEEVQLRYNKLLEGWTVEFSPLTHAPLNVLRLPVLTSNDELDREVKKIAAQYAIDPSRLSVKITRAGDISKPSGAKGKDLHGSQLKEASKDSRWHNTPKSYHSWRGMKDRCLNKSNKDYPRYGGRGITICDEWIDDYAQFVEDMGEPPDPDMTLDRRDNDGPYSPKNCRWATRKQQANNRSED